MRSLILICVSLMAALAHAQPPANVVIDEARMQTVERLRRVTGELRALQRSRLAAREEGQVLTLSVRAGDAVERGQVIATLDPVLAELTVASGEANLDALRASVAEQQAEVDRAQFDFDRIQSLVERSSASSQEFEDARVDLASAQARYQRAVADVAASEARLALDKQRLKDMVIRAPFNAKVIATQTDVGQWLSIGDVVCELYAVDSIEAWVDVPESVVERMSSVGDAVSVQIPALSGELSGTITQIVPAVDPMSRLFPVRIAVPNERTILQPGMSVTAMIPTGAKEDMLTISKDAILRDDAGEFVYMAVPNEQQPDSPFKEIAVPVRITRQFAIGDRVAVMPGGLYPGARLIVEGNERMFPTQPIIDVSATARENRAQPQAQPAEQEQGS
ncbi:MAG: efflux RND transporter periplasmic adaptor subunit [Phycisphaera sp.]|nr:efflux RND transporter periplasmic adaptor subunit [Phycisphaera sp.]